MFKRTISIATLLIALVFSTTCQPIPELSKVSSPPPRLNTRPNPTYPPVITTTPTLTPTPIPSTPTLAVTATQNPLYPCGGILPERVYLFLDCNDIRRIRREITSSEELGTIWNSFRAYVDGRYPSDYYSDLLWGGGGGHYIARDMALVYLVTGNAHYAKNVLRLLQDVKKFTHRESPDLLARLMANPMHYGISYQSVAFAYTTIRNTNLLTDEERIAFDDFLIEQGKYLEEISWSVDGNAAVALFALAAPEHPDSMKLLRKARSKLDWELKVYFDSNGGDTLYADNYTTTTFQGLLSYAESVYKTLGEDIYKQDYGGKSIYTMCEWYLKVMTPEGTLLALNDGVWVNLDPGLLRLCAMRTNDQALAFAADRYLYGYLYAFRGWFKTGNYFSLFNTIAWADQTIFSTDPTWTSVLLPKSGLAIFRSGWSLDDQYLSIQFTDTNKHNHYSFGNIVLYDNGPWMLDNGYQLDEGGYMGEQHERSMKTSEHSTLTLDNTNQNYSGGKAQFFSALSQASMTSVHSDPYAGFQQTRTILWAKPWHQWLVIDDAIGVGSNHTLQLHWYIKATPSGEEGLWLFKREDQRLYLNMLPGIPANYKLVSRKYGGFPQGNSEGVEMEVAPEMWPVRLASVLTVSDTNSAPLVQRSDSINGTLIFAEQGEQTWEWLMPKNSAGLLNVDEFSLEGRAGWCLSKAEALVGYGLFDGKALQQRDLVLIKSIYPLSIETTFPEKAIIVDATKSTEIGLYWPTDILSIINERGDSIDFERDGDILILQVPAGRQTLTILGNE